MNKTEQEIYNRALSCAKSYKEELDTLKEKIRDLKGFCTVMAKNPQLEQSTKEILFDIAKQL